MRTAGDGSRLLARPLKIAAAVGVVLLMGFAVRQALSVRVDTPETTPRKRLGVKFFDELSLSRHGLYGVRLVTCKSCRMKKRRLGLLSLGAFNVVCVEGLDITLPTLPRGGETPDGTPPAAPPPASPQEVAAQLGIDGKLMSLRDACPAFSGLEITGLSISRLDAATNAVPRLRASRATAVSGGLDLRNCLIIDGDTTRVVERAALKVGRTFRVEWPEGTFDI